MRGAFICSRDAVLQQHDGKCFRCQEAITQILVQTGIAKPDGRALTNAKGREWFRAHYEPTTQTFVQHKCGHPPLQAAA